MKHWSFVDGPLPVITERQWRMVAFEPNSGCWIWMGATIGHMGYGSLNVEGKSRLAHRTFYAAHKGHIPVGKVIDHLCRMPLCVNPDHMEPVLAKENSFRGDMTRRTRTHCANGHPLALYAVTRPGTNRTECLECRRDYNERQKGRR